MARAGVERDVRAAKKSYVVYVDDTEKSLQVV